MLSFKEYVDEAWDSKPNDPELAKALAAKKEREKAEDEAHKAFLEREKNRKVIKQTKADADQQYGSMEKEVKAGGRPYQD